MGHTYEQELERRKKGTQPQKAGSETTAPAKKKKDRGWNLWTKAMNKLSGGHFYKAEKANHDRQKKRQSDIALSMPDANEADIIKTPTGSRERQENIRQQLASYANAQMDQTDRVNAFVQKEYGLEDSTKLGSVAGRMMQGLFRDTGDAEADYEYNRTVGDYVPKLLNGTSSIGRGKQESVADALGGNEIFMISSIITPVIDELREIRDGEGYEVCALTNFGKAKQMLGKINSIQDILKNYSGNEDVRNAIYKLSGTDKAEFSALTMNMSLALRDAAKSMGADLGMDNISSYQNTVAAQERKKREDAKSEQIKAPRKREAEYAALKANQRSFIQEKGVLNESAHRHAYMALAMKDKARMNNVQSDAMRFWISSSGSFAEVLRNKVSFEKMKNSAQDKKKRQEIELMEGQVGVMDSIFADNAGLEESMEAYRGVQDGFLTFLFQQRGYSKKDYLKKDGGLDYQKIDKKGLLKGLIGMTYQDNCFVSTTTNRGYAAMWANQMEFSNARQIRDEVLAQSRTAEGSREREELERYSESVMLQQTESQAGGHMMIMNLPAGTKGIFSDAMGSTSKDSSKQVGAPQNEITLDRGLIYKITDVSGSAGSYQLYVTVVGSGAKKEAKRYDPKTDTRARAAFDTGIQDV